MGPLKVGLTAPTKGHMPGVSREACANGHGGGLLVRGECTGSLYGHWDGVPARSAVGWLVVRCCVGWYRPSDSACQRTTGQLWALGGLSAWHGGSGGETLNRPDRAAPVKQVK